MQLVFGGKTTDKLAIELLQAYATEEPYYLGFSGGKDSVVIYDLAKRANIQFDAHYNVSPIDPPEIRDFIKANYPEVIWDYSARGFWGKPFMSHGPPRRSRMGRWCCALIKECGGKDRVKILGMRSQESSARSKYKCFMNTTHNQQWLLPIVNWQTSDVWQYIAERQLLVCSLYKEGFERIGCVLCPCESPATTKLEMARYPKIARCWRIAMDRYFDVRIERNTPLPFTSKDEFWYWWISRKKWVRGQTLSL